MNRRQRRAQQKDIKKMLKEVEVVMKRRGIEPKATLNKNQLDTYNTYLNSKGIRTNGK